MTAHRYWRLNATGDNGAGSIGIFAMELRATPLALGGANLSVTGNGTASASSTYSTFVAANAFDANPATYWNSSPGSYPAQLEWDFGAGNEQTIVEVTVNCNSAGYNPTGAFLQYSDDNSTWYNIITMQPISSGGGTFTFAIVYGEINVTMPSAVVLGYGRGSVQIVDQPPVAVGYGGANAPLVMPYALVAANSASKIALTMPAPQVYGAGHDATGERSFTATLPLCQVSGLFGGGAALTAPAAALAASGTGTVLGEFNLPQSPAVITASGTTTALGRAAMTTSLATLVGYSGAVCSVTDNGVTLQASGTGGTIGTGAVTLPLFTLAASGTTRRLSSASLIMPSPVLGAGGNVAWLVMPGVTMVAVGSATVTVTYEGYSLNLKHSAPLRPGETQVDELTHYTNYPFDRIVRYQNSYFGVAPDGLYLLEGTTDYDLVTPTEVHYTVQTALTDFGIHEKKTVVAMYIGGRLGPTATVSITAGEDLPTTYNYQTPRDATAQTFRQTFGKGIKTRYCAFGLDGRGPLAIDTLDFDLAKMTRRI